MKLREAVLDLLFPPKCPFCQRILEEPRAPVCPECRDKLPWLRGGASLCVAALAAEGETRVSQICHIDRGYEDLARDLRALGADAVRVEETENG